MAKFPTLLTNILLGRTPGDDGRPHLLGVALDLVEVLSDDEHAVAVVGVEHLLEGVQLDRVLRRQAEALATVTPGVAHAEVGIQGDPQLRALGGGDPSLALQDLPRNVVELGPDEGENVIFLAVLAYQRGRETEATQGLDLRGHAEDRGGQEMHLVVDHEAPVAGLEQPEVDEVVCLGAAVREDLVGRDGDVADVLHFAGVLTHHVLGEVSLVDEFGLPLADRREAGGQHEGLPLDLRHGADSHHGLAGSAGQDNHSGASTVTASSVEDPDRVLLVGPKPHGLAPDGVVTQFHLEEAPVHVPGDVLHGVAEADHGLLDVAAHGGVHLHAPVLRLGEQELPDVTVVPSES
jgi:hypothetical protein